MLYAVSSAVYLLFFAAVVRPTLADSVRHSVITVLQPDNSRETKISGSEIYLLHHAVIPAVMVECGFLSNPEETKKLKDDNYQRKLAFLIALGIMDFINKTEAV